MPRKFLLLTFFLFVSVSHYSQDSIPAARPWSVALAPHYGFVIPHTKQIEHLIQGHSYGLFAQILRPVSGNTYWHQAYNYPEQAFDFVFINTGNPGQLGQQYSSSFLLNLPLNRKSKWLDLSDISLDNSKKTKTKNWLGLGIGLGYVTKIWDLQSNHQAAVLGSQVNAALTLQYSRLIATIGGQELRAGIRISHFSNGAFQLPNLGTNNASLFISSVWRTPKSNVTTLMVPSHWERNRFTLAAVGGLKEIPPPYGKKFFTGVLSFLADRRVSYKSSFGLGADLLYNSSLHTLMERKAEVPVPTSQVIQAGILFSYTMHFNDFELKMQQGVYLLDHWKVDGKLYHRFGLRYFLSDHFFTQLTLKTHFAKADYGELGCGIAW
jgi:hypothetical protein